MRNETTIKIQQKTIALLEVIQKEEKERVIKNRGNNQLKLSHNRRNVSNFYIIKNICFHNNFML